MGGGVWREAKELGGSFSPCFQQYFLVNSPHFFSLLLFVYALNAI